MELWNRKYLSAPPSNSAKTCMDKKDVSRFRSTFEEAVKVLDTDELFMKECEVLSRVIYKGKKRYRGHKGFSILGKINQGLRRYLSLDLLNVYNMFSGSFEVYGKFVYLPTKQNLQCILVRTQGFAKLMYFITTCCQDAAFHFRDRVLRGLTWGENLVLLGIISRIWCFARYFVLCACQWYSQLLPFLEKLEEPGVQWLPHNYDLPKDLMKWLGPDVLCNDMFGSSDIAAISKDIFQLTREEITDDLGEPVSREAVEKDGSLLSVLERGKVLLEAAQNRTEEEVGISLLSSEKNAAFRGGKSASNLEKAAEVHHEICDRKSDIMKIKRFDQAESKRRVISPSMKKVKVIKTVTDLKLFLQQEKKARLEKKDCVTQNLTKREWKTLVSTLRLIVKKSSPGIVKNAVLPTSVIKKVRRRIISYIR